MSGRAIAAHPLAERFPPMSEADFAALVADIKANGLHEPITLYKGLILDGRHRYRACEQIGIPPAFEMFEGTEKEAAALVDSLNLHRRHLTIAERRALVMEELKRDPAQSDRLIAKKTGADRETVARARLRDVDGGGMPPPDVRVGADGVAQPARKRPGVRPGAKLRTDRAPEIRELVSEGHNVDQIAEAQGVSVQQVRNIMRSEGIKIAVQKTSTTHASSIRVSTETVDLLVGAARGLDLFRRPGINVSKADAAGLLPELRNAMKTLRWFEASLKEIANG